MAITIVATIAMKPSDAKAAKGTWVQTGTKYFAYKNGAEQYVSKQNQYYKQRCYYRGVTKDNYVKVRAYKKIVKKKYYGKWSATKLSKRIRTDLRIGSAGS